MNTNKYQSLRKGQKKSFFAKALNDEEFFGTTNLKAVIYVRVSSQQQVQQGHGLESQERACRERCENQKGVTIEVVRVFREEGVSGSLMDRKAIIEAIDFLAKENKVSQKVHYFIVTDPDRIARPDDIAEALGLENDIEKTGVRIVTINGKRDKNTDEGKLLSILQYGVAGYERTKILRRTMNGRLNSIKSGGRPFPSPPLGYIREHISDKTYIDHIDVSKKDIIKQGLELYAYNPTFTKTQLQKFWLEKGLRTSKSSDKLYISFIDKTLFDYRLYFYAGYIYYPERGIEEPFKGKHEAIISREVAEKIIEKDSQKKSPTKRGANVDEGVDTHPLKKLVICESCGRTYGCYPAKGRKYFYYDCGNKYCRGRIYVRKEEMEDKFKKFITTMCIPHSIFKLFKAILLQKREERKKTLVDSIPKLQGELLSINDRIEKVKQKIITTYNEQLSKELEDDRAKLCTIRDVIDDKINNKKSDEYDIQKTLDAIEPIFTDPVLMRQNSNYEIRQLLFKVRFGGILYYKKDQGYRTNDISGLYSVFSQFGKDDYSDTSQRGFEPLPTTSEIVMLPLHYWLIKRRSMITLRYGLSKSDVDIPSRLMSIYADDVSDKTPSPVNKVPGISTLPDHDCVTIDIDRHGSDNDNHENSTIP